MKESCEGTENENTFCSSRMLLHSHHSSFMHCNIFYLLNFTLIMAISYLLISFIAIHLSILIYPLRSDYKKLY